MIDFSESELKRLSDDGISTDQIRDQLEIFKTGIPHVILEKAALVGNGIVKLAGVEEQRLIRYYEESIQGLKVLKFVPASGAASRMFKMLFHFLETYEPEKESIGAYLKRTGDEELTFFFEKQSSLPFFELINNRIKGKATSADEESYLFIKEMLLEEKCNYGFYPKGLLPFHKYGDYVATPFEEHLKEGAQYASVGGEAHLHFTISKHHGPMFNLEFSKIKARVSFETKNSFHVSYSYQWPSTDTIAVSPDNKPFRDKNGELLFRPGGHGALIENLNEQEADLIFIKNIDNVSIPENAVQVMNSKKILGGLLIEVQVQAFEFARLLEVETLTGEQLDEIKTFLEERLNVRLSERFHSCSIQQQIEILKDKINRPIRVCGMVKNVGEPGGGPFWMRDSQGNISLQIVESAQVDINSEEQKAIFRNASHFNPVDVVCAVRNHKGEKYNLLNFIDKRQGFISFKTAEGVSIKALELPGLWNGAMAFWNTIFVEVPLVTFNPVKTVNDLLKPSHQVR